MRVVVPAQVMSATAAELDADGDGDLVLSTVYGLEVLENRGAHTFTEGEGGPLLQVWRHTPDGLALAGRAAVRRYQRTPAGARNTDPNG